MWLLACYQDATCNSRINRSSKNTEAQDNILIGTSHHVHGDEIVRENDQGTKYERK